MARRDLLGSLDDEDDDEPEVKIIDLKTRGKYHKSTDAAAMDIMGGVTLRWFQVVFSCDLKTVKRAVEGVKPIRVAPGGSRYYLVKDVVPRLVKPVVSLDDYLKNIDPDDLPEKLRETYWNVQKKSQQVRQIAGELWKTTDVIEVIGETFKHIKNTIMMWSDTVEEQTEFSDEQRRIFRELTDELQKDIHKTVISRAKSKKQTGSQLKEIDGEVFDDVDI